MTTKSDTEVGAGCENQKKYLSKDETARMLGVTRRTLEHWMRRGLIPFYRIGRTVRFNPVIIEAHLEATCRFGAVHYSQRPA